MTRANTRHRVPSRWCHLEREGEVLTVAELLDRNHRQPVQHRSLWCRLIQYGRGHARAPRRVTVIPLPRTPLTSAGAIQAPHRAILAAPCGAVSRTGPPPTAGGSARVRGNQEAPSRYPSRRWGLLGKTPYPTRRQ